MSLKKTAITLVVFAAVFLTWNYPRFIEVPRACEEPISYNIGTFDRRFGISQRDFLSALTLAEAIWEKPSGIELFVYKPETGRLVINLIYDYRQEVTSTLSDLESTVEEDETAYNALQARYKGLKTFYESAKSVYDARVKVFEEKNDAYQSQVDSWNMGKRNSKEQFNQLEITKVALEAEIGELKEMEKQLNETVREINSLVGMLNRLAKSLNLNVEVYNTIGASRGETFTGGLYHSAEGEQGIDIYEFSSREKLVRVLTHELGHALGLEHVDDQEAMMYYLNEGDAKALTKTDLAALQALCYTEDIRN